jgi:hypothetical protein
MQLIQSIQVITPLKFDRQGDLDSVVRNMIHQNCLHKKKVEWLGVLIVESKISDKVKGKNWATFI